MLLPAALGAAIGALWLSRPPRQLDVLPPAVSDPDGPVEALGGRLEGDLGTALVAQLAPLHPDPQRQAFEARALARRFDLPDGQPWRLSVHWEAGALVDGGAVVHLGEVAVHDAEGPALESIAPDAERAGSLDPVRSLFAAPTGTLGPGERIDWVLWGREPATGAAGRDEGDSVRLVGLLPAGAASEELTRRTGLAGTIELRPRTVRRSELMLPVARLDRSGSLEADPGAAAGDPEAGDSGKSQRSDASAASAGTPAGEHPDGHGSREQ